MSAETKVCPQCGTKNVDLAKFCVNCGFRFREERMPRKPAVPAPAHGAPAPQPVAAAAPAKMDAHGHADEDGEAHSDGHSATHHSQAFYLGIFGALALITLIEIAFTNTDSHALRLGALIPLSITKFALVGMFFMHLKGDKKIFTLLFVGPLFIAAGVLLSLVALFSNFEL